ncbi:hypothetical protein HAZT_HAZT001488 [Hyalella azteca]|uniref:Alkaline phosphatase n=1 Tax=Hyalella azteca TaxID=294128 RepID=A0A6A0GWY1_HYAAZ|nr:hypothetical protein HAZT_HAZT001488 [Hyalella azteca]
MHASSQQWWNLARTELAAALNVRDNWNVARNVILFLGDGMGITASTAARIYKGQKKGMNGEEGYLVWERFPNNALIKTYNVDRQVPDSAATATAFLCGVKVNYETIGLDPVVPFDDCEASKDVSTHLTSVLQWAQDANKATGIVTSTRITHATPAATYSRVANRRWECNRSEGMAGHGCPDIAEQLVHHNPGKNIKVILGGGRQPLGATLGIPDEFTCNRTDNKDLTSEWMKSKHDAGFKARYITSAAELRSLDHSSLDYVMGLFADSHLPFVEDQAPGSSNTPSLAEMAIAAVRQLQKEDAGFFLLVEGGRIDHAYHNNLPKKALEETIAFDEAITAVLKEVDLDETLVVVTADHSHVLTINGYPNRGNDILGLADVSDVDGLPYTTLMFTNGPGFNITSNGKNVTRADPREYPLQHGEHMSQTAVPLKAFQETHGGEDVALYAAGPMSHLFHRLHEQNYIAHVMAYAACIGPSAGENCGRPSFASKLDDDDAFSLPHSPLKRSSAGFNDLSSVAPEVSAAAAAQVASSAGIRMTSAAGTPLTGRPLFNVPKKPTHSQASSASSSPAKIGSKSKTSSSSSAHKFPTLSPTLQSLLDRSQQSIINALGLERIQHTQAFSSVQDVSNLLGKPAFEAPSHDM